MTLTTVFDPYRAAQAIANIDLIKATNPGCYTLDGVPYVATMTPAGIVLQKAARSNLQTGATKEKNGVTYVFNENRRWTRQDKKKGNSRAKGKPPAGSPVNDGSGLRPKKTQKKGKQWGPKASTAPASKPVVEGKTGARPRRERAAYQAVATAAENYAPSLESLFAQAGVTSPTQTAIDKLVSSGNHTPESAKAAIEWASQVRTGAEAKLKQQILQQAGLMPSDASTQPKNEPKANAKASNKKPSQPSSVTPDRVVDAIRELDQVHDTDNYLPIFHLRNKFPNLSRSEMDEMLFQLQAEDRIELSTLQDVSYYSDDEVNAGIPQNIGGAWFYISTNEETPSEVEPTAGGEKSKPAEPQSGGSIAPSGGKLAATPKAPAASSAEGQEAINQRYASANPSESDVNGWLQDSIQEYLSPSSDRAIHAETLKELKIMNGVYEGHVTGDLADTYKKIRDRQSFAEGVADSNEHYVNVVRKGKLMTPEDVGLWSNETELKSAERRMKSGKTEASRAKAKQEFEKLSAKKAQHLADATEIADKMNAKYTAPREEQIQQYLKVYDDKIAAVKAEREQLHQQYLKGNKKAVETVTEKVLRPLDSFDATNLFEGRKKVKNPDRVYREAVRSHLIQEHQQGGGDFATLGLQGRPNSPEELKAAYRRAASQNHPDRGGSRDAFEQVRGAYERLADDHFPDMRKSLDPYFTLGRDRYVVTVTPRGVVLKKAAMNQI